MSAALSYSIEEAREILLDQAISLESHIYLEGRREEYVRSEDYERPAIIQSSFRHIWTSAHPDWDWDDAEGGEEDLEYCKQREATHHWFRSNTRIRGGFKRLPSDVDKAKWTPEDVCGHIYKSAIQEWVEAKSGFIPGSADGFLAQYRRARSKLFNCLSTEQQDACQRTADEWNGVSVPLDVQVQNFNNKFASVCRAFTMMLIKDYGVFPFVFYVGVPGNNIPAGLYEVMRKQGLAAQTFRSFTKLESVFRDMKSYVNMNIDTPVFGGLNRSKQTPPPWKALSENPSRLVAKECLLDEDHRFGSSPEKTHAQVRNALIKHWFQEVGYLEFHHYFARGGLICEPEKEPWHGLRKYDKDLTGQWLSNERTPRGPRAGPSASSANREAVVNVKFGGNGPRVILPSNSPYAALPDSCISLPEGRPLPDPDDVSGCPPPPFRPGRPSWPAPSMAPDTVYARLQWASQILQETGGMAAQTLLEALKWIAILPPVANYDYDAEYFRPQAGKRRKWTVESYPTWVSWKAERCYIETQTEIDGLSDFLLAKPWSFEHEGKQRFSGVQMAWIIGLSGVLYVRALRQNEEAFVSPPSRWSLSGGPEWQKQIRDYRFPLTNDQLRVILLDFKCYLEDLALSMRSPGLPPTLSYCHFPSREQYVLHIIKDAPQLQDLAEHVLNMPRTGSKDNLSLPVFSGRSVWQLPHMGIPRSSMRSDLDVGALRRSFIQPTIFLDEKGGPLSAESGLSALLEFALVAAELSRILAPASDLPAYLRNSPLAEASLCAAILSDLLSAAAEQSEKLCKALENSSTASRSPHLARRPPAAEGETAAEAALRRHAQDVDGDLLAHRREVEADPLKRRLRAAVSQAAARQDLYKANERLRNDQNAQNLASHQSIHPKKPPADPLILPDLDHVHRPLQYTTGEPPIFTTGTGSSHKRGVRPKARAIDADPSSDRTRRPRTSRRALKSDARNAVAVSASNNVSDASSHKRKAANGETRVPAKYRRASIGGSSTGSPTDPARIPLFLPDGSDDRNLSDPIDSDDELPPTISIPRKTSGPAVSAFSNQDTEGSGVHARLSLDPVAVSPGEEPGGEDAAFRKTALLPEAAEDRPKTLAPRPRPRRKNPQAATTAGISTAFDS
ncbi:unnamed protein product [Peniophora sp. CBMAI 1063]|nr:unnamed protein product [Peniophora sp. CBMAI 1063]